VASNTVVSLLTLRCQSNHSPVYEVGRKPGTNVFRPLSSRHAIDEVFPGLLILRTEGCVHFVKARRVGDKIWAAIPKAKPHVLVPDSSTIPDVEFRALKMLVEMDEKLREGGAELWLVALYPRVLEIIKRSELAHTLIPGRLFFDLELAVQAYEANRKGPPVA
jgi:SulP family sulfate permease